MTKLTRGQKAVARSYEKYPKVMAALASDEPIRVTDFTREEFVALMVEATDPEPSKMRDFFEAATDTPELDPNVEWKTFDQIDWKNI